MSNVSDIIYLPVMLWYRFKELTEPIYVNQNK